MPQVNNPTAIILHHEAAANGFKSVDASHKTRWPNFVSSLGYWMGYHYYISFEGMIYIARKENEEGAHCFGGWNTKSIGICLMGNLSLQSPTEAQENALQGLVEAIQQRWGIPDSKIYSHGELWPTECPGQNGIKLVEKLREAKPDLVILQKQISVIAEMISKLKILFQRFFGK